MGKTATLGITAKSNKNVLSYYMVLDFDFGSTKPKKSSKLIRLICSIIKLFRGWVNCGESQ